VFLLLGDGGAVDDVADDGVVLLLELLEDGGSPALNLSLNTHPSLEGIVLCHFGGQMLLVNRHSRYRILLDGFFYRMTDALPSSQA
jgi:hypothetical protein